MSTKRFYLIILLLAVGCQQVSIGQNKPAVSSNNVPATKQLDPQLKVNKEALDKGSVDAATVMLNHNDPTAREILLSALNDSKNSAARIAICKALMKARLSKVEIKNKEDFIQPLLGVFSTENQEESQLAAEAILIFEYDKIGELLESITTDASKPVKMRVNAIHALKLWPNMEATIRLIRLVDDAEETVSGEAEKALRSLGIPVGENYWVRQDNISVLKDKGPDEFMREWIIRQETQMSNLRKEVELWQNIYLSALDTIYDGMSDESARGKFLIEHLGNSEVRIKLWAMDKVYEWQFASGRQRLPAELEPILLKLISDPDKDVRLKTAGLSVLGRMNSAEPLLTQLEAESDDQVKIALLDALGGACSIALSVKPAKITPEVRKRALEFSKQFLSEEDTSKARKGAEVLPKLLERNGLEQEELEGYLGLLVTRYNQQKENPDSALREALLRAMASLCTQNSAGRVMAAKLFRPLFIEALSDKTDFVRERAVDGLIYIDPAAALARLRTNFYDDSSETLRKRLIDLAGEVGGREDLPKLAGKIGSNSESGPAWQAMLKIFDGSDSATLNEWMDKLIIQNSNPKLTEQQKIAFLKKVEAKAAATPKVLASVIEKLADLYYTTGQFERAAEYLDRQYKAASTAKEKDALRPRLVDASLRGSKVDLAAKLIGECLVKEDFNNDNAVLNSVSNFMNKPSGAEPDTVLKALRSVKFSGARPQWEQWLKNWTNRLGKNGGAEKTKEGAGAKKA